MNKRIALTVTILFLYGILFNFYICLLLHVAYRYAAIFYNCITFGMLLFAVNDLKRGFVGKWHEQLNLLCFLSLGANYTLIICTHTFELENAVPMFLIFNSGMLPILAIVIMRSFRFKKV